MQQYFADKPLKTGEEYIFTKEQAHHARDVLRMNHERIRLVYDGKGYFADAYPRGREFAAMVESEDPNDNELSVSVTLCAALIRREKMEFVLQKAAELGVSRIVPFESSRCVVREKKEKSLRLKERWTAILREASEQCKRSRIPELTDITDFDHLKEYMGDANLAAYENAYGTGRMLSECLRGSSITVVIGPEGGFSKEEVEKLAAAGFEPVSLGSRILRAETASVYACSVIAEWAEVRL